MAQNPFVDFDTITDTTKTENKYSTTFSFITEEGIVSFKARRKPKIRYRVEF